MCSEEYQTICACKYIYIHFNITEEKNNLFLYIQILSEVMNSTIY